MMAPKTQLAQLSSWAGKPMRPASCCQQESQKVLVLCVTGLFRSLSVKPTHLVSSLKFLLPAARNGFGDGACNATPQDLSRLYQPCLGV